jgi:hypothetical protein
MLTFQAKEVIMRDTIPVPRLLGYVQLRVGSRILAIPVQAMKLDADGGKAPGGFYTEGSTLGIYVDETRNAADVAEQIERASNDAAKHFARTLLN